MKYKIALLFALALITMGCVQDSRKRTILFSVEMPNTEGIETVGIRGSDKPLNWETDFLLKYDLKSKKYKGVVTMNTGYLFTEVKFTANGKFEAGDNRKLIFKNSDTLNYHAIFNVENAKKVN